MSTKKITNQCVYNVCDEMLIKNHYGGEYEKTYFSTYHNDDIISKQAKEVFVDNEFKQHVISFVKFNDMIRERKQEIKELTNDKKPCEEFIIKYLEAQEESSINLNGHRIIKNQSCTKTALKMDVIKDAILDEIKKLDPEDKAIERLDKIMMDMDEKRPTKTRANLKRTFERQKNTKK